MIRTYHRTKDDQQVSESDALDERGQLRDGFTMRTKLTLMDGVPVAGLADEQRRAHVAKYKARVRDAWRNLSPVALTDEQRREQIAKYNARVGDAWRNPSPVDPAHEARVRDAVLAAVTDPYEKYDRRVQDAWRS
jgi:hypothetical protein